MKHLFTIAMMLLEITAMAETVEGIIVTAGDTQAQFPLSEIREITFSDEQMTVFKTDGTDISFPAEWSLTFGQVETTGINFTAEQNEQTATIYSLDGTVVAEYKHISEFNTRILPHGTYIIRIGGKSIKIQR